MNTTNHHSHWDPREGFAAVRTLIEEEFPSLRNLQPHVLELALNEAAALAWQTGFPYLFFPVLAMEKACAVAAWHLRQQFIRRTEPILSLAA
jgi:hypothetical protein